MPTPPSAMRVLVPTWWHTRWMKPGAASRTAASSQGNLTTQGWAMGRTSLQESVARLFKSAAMLLEMGVPGNSEVLQDIAKCIRAHFKVLSIQGCLEYGFEASSPEMADDAALPKTKAEAWAFCAQALPFVHEFDAPAAAALKATMMLDAGNTRPDFAIVKAAFSGENINKMGLKCADVGSLDLTTYCDVFPLCKDQPELMTNPFSDSSVCGSVPMPNNPNSAVTIASSWLMLAVTVNALRAHVATLDATLH